MEALELHPLLLTAAIFCARVLDVSLGTLRTIIVFRGYRAAAAAIGFVEVLIWLGAASQVLTRLDAWYLALAFAAGFAAGNVVGIWLESKLAIGSELVRAVSASREVRLAEHLRTQGYGVTELEGAGEGGAPVEVLLIVESRRRVPHMLRCIAGLDPDAICTMSDVRRPRAPGPIRQRAGPLSALLRLTRVRK